MLSTKTSAYIIGKRRKKNRKRGKIMAKSLIVRVRDFFYRLQKYLAHRPSHLILCSRISALQKKRERSTYRQSSSGLRADSCGGACRSLRAFPKSSSLFASLTLGFDSRQRASRSKRGRGAEGEGGSAALRRKQASSYELQIG